MGGFYTRKKTNVSDPVRTPSSFVQLGRVTINGSGTNIIRFSFIPQIYQDLEIRYSARFNYVEVAGTLAVYPNNDTAASSYGPGMYWQGNTNVSKYTGLAGANTSRVGIISGTSTLANIPSNGIVRILNYTSTYFYKHIYENGVWNNGGASINQQFIDANSIVWLSFQPITSLTIVGDPLLEGSVFSLYGIGQN
jgi:hypothetical protein